MRHTWEQIQNIMSQRRNFDAPLIRRMVATRDHYNGDVTIPLINVQGEPEMDVLMPFLIADGVEGTAMRANGPMPTIHVPALDDGKETGKGSHEYARTRRRAYYARWHKSRLPLLMGRSYRQLVAYGTFSLTVLPDFDAGGARIGFRDALGAYPDLRSPDDVCDPTNVGFVYGRSPEYLLGAYPARLNQLQKMFGDWAQKRPVEALWDIVEWIDDTDIVIGVLGPRSLYAVDTVTGQTAGMQIHGMELSRVPNRVGWVPCVVPRRITLDRMAGQMEKIIPMEEWSAKLMALDFIAAERFTFPDMVVLGDEGRAPQIVGTGGWRDGRTGVPNLLQNVKAVQQLQASPGPMTSQTLDRIERAARISSGNTPFYGGETTGSLRTGRAIDALGGFSVDPRIAEVQLIMQYALETVNRAIHDTELNYFRNRKMTVFSGWGSDRGQVEYVPGKHFESPENAVTYSFPGSDVSQITVAVAQLNGAKLMSRHTARDKHPYIEDAEEEDRLTVQESVDDAMLVAFEQQIAGGQIAFQAVAEFRTLLNNGRPWPEALLQVNENEQKRQAMQAQMMQAQQAAGAPGGPATQPGLGGGPQPTASVPPPQQGVVNVASMVRALAAGPRAARAAQQPVGPGAQ